MKSGLRRRIAIIGGLIILGALAVVVWRSGGATFLRAELAPPSREAMAAAVPVTAVIAKRADVPEVVETIGSVQSIDSIAVQSQANGPIVKIEFQPGQDVKKGQELFLIDPRPYQAALEQAQAQLAHDKATLAEAQMDQQRYQKLAQENSIAAQQAQDQVYVVKQDEGTVQIDEANVKTAQINLGYAHITAPIAGRAGVVLVDLGNLVGPQNNISSRSSQSAGGAANAGVGASSGTSGQTASAGGLVTIAQMRPIYVNFSVPETMLDKVVKAQAADPLVVEAYSQSGQLLETGKLTVIDNQVNAATGSVTMQGTFANVDEKLWPGEFVSVRLVSGTRRNVVTIPAQAVMSGPSGSYVYVVSPDRTARRVNVKVTARHYGIAVIGEGVSAGETVVLDGQYRLANGVRVEVRQTGPDGLAAK